MKNLRHSRESLFHCLKLGNMYAETGIVIELYDRGFEKMSFTMASDQEECPSLRIGGEKYCVACSPGRVRCNNDHVMEGKTFIKLNRSDDQAYFLDLTFIRDNSSRLSSF